MKKILLIGATGTIGLAIQQELAKEDCTVIAVGNRSGDYQVDLDDSKSITQLYQAFPDVDAVVSAAARGVVFGPLVSMTKSQYIDSMQSKLLGQIDLVIQGVKLLKPDVSFTLTTGALNRHPIKNGTAAAMINGAIDDFVRAAAIDMPAKQRINVVTPDLLVESKEHYKDVFGSDYKAVPAAQVARAYREAIFGQQTGQVINPNNA